MALNQNLMIALSTFYLCLFTLMGVMPSDIGVDYDNEVGEGIQDFLDFIFDLIPFVGNFLVEYVSPPVSYFLGNLFSNISGMPTIVSTLIFTPILIVGVLWFMDYWKGVTS